MSTKDVPGARADNNDELAMGCWAEHSDGSMIFVESAEAGRVVYSIFDRGRDPITEYRDAMDEDDFKEFFSWSDGKGGKRSKKGKTPEPWTWHDKTPFPWDKIIGKGARDGMRFASARDQLSAAERVAESLKLRGEEVRLRDLDPAAKDLVSGIAGRLKRAIDAFLGEDKA